MNKEPKTILVVDDDIDFLIQTETVLKAQGFNVVKAESQSEAEELLKKIQPDLAILDLMMEHFDGGFALAYHIKKIDPDIPVITLLDQGRSLFVKADPPRTVVA